MLIKTLNPDHDNDYDNYTLLLIKDSITTLRLA